MESNQSEPATRASGTSGHGVDLREIDRAAAAPFLDYPELPAWWPIVAGVWFALVFASGFTTWIGAVGLRVGAIALLIAVLAFFLRWYVARRGVMPSTDPRVAPPEIGRAMRWYYAGVALCAVVIAASFLWAPSAAAVAVTFVLVTIGIALYDRAYRRAAARVRARLA